MLGRAQWALEKHQTETRTETKKRADQLIDLLEKAGCLIGQDKARKLGIDFDRTGR